MSRGLLLLCAVALTALVAPSSAHAASFNCEASALRLAAAGLAPQEPVTANAGSTSCAPADFGGGLPATPLPLTGGGVFAHTGITGSDPLSQVASASAGIGDITVTSLLPGIPAPDLSALPGGGVFSVPGIGTVDIRPALMALIQPTELHVKVTPGEQVRNGDRLTRRALHVVIAGGTTTVLDAVVGEAVVDATGVSCGSIAAAALGLGRDSRCTTRRITLIDVLQRGNRVALDGAADPRRFAGKRVRIVSNWDKHTVTRPKVAKNGLFRASLPLPPESVRHTNLARYMATIGKEHSLNLKLERRMIMTSANALGHRRVRLVGQVSLPLATPVQPIAIKRRVSCGHLTTVARVKPDARGHFSVTLKGPAQDRVYTFRFQTVVRHLASGRSLMETFTLPRYVLGT